MLLARIEWWSRRIVRPLAGLERIGSEYGGWVVPIGLLDSESIVLLAGVGLDVTFDLGLIERIGCKVHAVDPTPRSADYARSIVDPRFIFEQVGLWDEDTVQRFYAPTNPEHISHSIVKLQRTNTWFEADCRSVASLLRSLGHDHIDLLKLDIEGAEYRVIDQMLSDGVLPGILCLEFDELHHPLDESFRRRLRGQVKRLMAMKYRLVHADRAGSYTFVHEPWLHNRAVGSRSRR